MWPLGYSKPLGRIVLANPALPTVPLNKLLWALAGNSVHRRNSLMFFLQYIQACRSTSNTIPGRLEKLVSVSKLLEKMAYCLELGVTPTSASLQVKLSGSHLTPQCYSFITYVQVRPKLTVAKSQSVYLVLHGVSAAIHVHLWELLIFFTWFEFLIFQALLCQIIV